MSYTIRQSTIPQTVLDELEVGETVRINHDDCEAGTDTRARLYLTRPVSKPDLVLAYCHNCQQGTSISVGSNYRDWHDPRYIKHGAVPNTVGEFSLPKTLIEDAKQWPVDAYAYHINTLGDYLDAELAAKIGIAYDPNTHRVYFPQYETVWIDENLNTHCNDLWGYQLRAIDGKGPKYLTIKRDQDSSGTTVLRYQPNLGDTYKKTVIVEDLLSGIAIVVASHGERKAVEVVVNYGLSVKLEALVNITGTDIYVWLDNDSSHVDERAKTFKRTIEMLHPFRNVKIVTDLNDPKRVDDGDIIDRIHRDSNGLN